MPVDTAWEDIYDATTHYSHDGGLAEHYDQEYQDNGERNLQRHLLSQLNLITLSVADKAIAIALVDAINDDGYLTLNLEEICATLSADLDTELRR